MSEDWKNGLYREYVKAIEAALENNRYGDKDYNFSQIGYEAVLLYHEMFDRE